MMKQSRLYFLYAVLKTYWYAVCALLVLLVAASLFFIYRSSYKGVIPVGVLYSLTGSMAYSEKNIADAVLLAIEEINQAGGIIGKKIKPIVVDGKSDDKIVEQEARNLIVENNVVAIFGCRSSSARKLVKKVVEEHDRLLMYSTKYEGVEESNHIVYVGPTPNQFLTPAITWAYKTIGTRFFIVGSENIFSRMSHAIIAEHIALLGGTLAGQAFIPVDSMQSADVVQQIVSAKPTVIINTILGNSNKGFFKELRAAGITPSNCPTVSLRISEPELQELDIPRMVDDYAVNVYFQSLDLPENEAFVARFKKQYGEKRVIGNNMESAYSAVYLWAKAVQEVETVETAAVVSSLRKQFFGAPSGVIYFDKTLNNAWRRTLIGKIRYDGQFDIVWNSIRSIAPNPYPIHRDKNVWESELITLYEGWGKQWQKVA